ncbi:MAG: hypothetical protein AB1397_04005 [bacterium]
MDFVFQCIFTVIGAFLSFILTLLFVQNGRQIKIIAGKMDEGFRKMDEGFKRIAEVITQEIASTKELIVQEMASTKELIAQEIASTKELIAQEGRATKELIAQEAASTRELIKVLAEIKKG